MLVFGIRCVGCLDGVKVFDCEVVNVLFLDCFDVVDLSEE